MKWLTFALFVQFCHAVTYEVCEEGGVAPWLTPSEVTLDPANPHRGDDAVFKISGYNSTVFLIFESEISVVEHTARSGEFMIDVYMVTTVLGRKRMLSVRKETDSLCDHTDCPLRPGNATINYTRHLPFITPPVLLFPHHFPTVLCRGITWSK